MPEQQLQLRIVLLGKEETLNQLNGLKQGIKDLSQTEISSYNAAKAAIQQKNLALKDAQLQLKQAAIAEKGARANATQMNAEAKAQAIAAATAQKQAAQQKVLAIKQEIAASQQALIEERQRTEQERQRAIASKTASQEVIAGKRAETEASRQALIQEQTKASQQTQAIRQTKEEQRQLNEQLKQERVYLNGLGAPIGSMARLRAETSQLRQEANRLNITTAEGANRFRTLQTIIDANARKIRDFDRSLSGSNTLVGEYSRGIGGAIGQLKGLLLSYVSIQGAISALRFTFNTNLKLDSLNRSLQIVSGSEAELSKNQEFLNEQIEKFGLNVFSATTGFRNFYASATKAGITADQTRHIYSQLAEVSANLRLSQDQENSAFLAFEQIISKGVVSMEELRRQLGNNIPGAFELAAKSMNLPVQEFNKLIKSGKILSTEFLPGFADELQKTFGNGAERVEGLQNSFNRLNNTLVALASDPNSGVNQFFKSLIDSLNTSLKLVDGFLDKFYSAINAAKQTNPFNAPIQADKLGLSKEAIEEQARDYANSFKQYNKETIKGLAPEIIKELQAKIIEQQRQVGLAEITRNQTQSSYDAAVAGGQAFPELLKQKQYINEANKSYKDSKDQLDILTKQLVYINDILHGNYTFPTEAATGSAIIASTGKTKNPPKLPELGLYANQGADKFKFYLDTLFKKFTEEEKKQIQYLKEQKLTPEDLFKQAFPDKALFSQEEQNNLAQYATTVKMVKEELEKAKDILGLTDAQVEQLANSMGTASSDELFNFNEKLKALITTAGDINNAFSLLKGTIEPIAENILQAIGNAATGSLDREITESQERMRELESDAQRATGNRKAELEEDIKNQRDYQNKLQEEKDKANQKYLKQQKILSLAELAIETAAAIAKINIAAEVAEAAALPQLAIPIVGEATYAATVGIAEAQRAKSIIFTLAAAAAQAAVIVSKKYALGGKVNGPSHERGGVNFVNQLSGNVEQMEGGEYVTKKSATKNNLRTLETINKWGDKIRFQVMPMYADGGLTAPLPLPRLPLPSGGGMIEMNNIMLQAINAINSRIDRLQVINNAQDTVKTNNRQQSIKQVQNF